MSESWETKPCTLGESIHPRTGYARCYVRGKRVRAHRAAWEKAYGPIPDGLWVLHHCDVRACIQPLHLFLGTHQDNMDDMNSKGRHARIAYAGPRGMAHPGAKLTEGKVIAIRKLYATGEWTQQDLANQYGISQNLVGGIVRRQRWRHVP